tara:strand:- start:351 stop:512 length:162 start_codon:yes stop_codon:yes gene_type:complete
MFGFLVFGLLFIGGPIAICIAIYTMFMPYDKFRRLCVKQQKKELVKKKYDAKQ